jgi:hypothetical protein
MILKNPIYFGVMIPSLGPTLLVMSKILPRNIIQTIVFDQTIKLQQSSITE